MDSGRSEAVGALVQVTDQDKAKAIADGAKNYHITQIVIGESQHSRWALMLRGSLTHRLLRSLKHTDVHIIATDKKGEP